MVYEEKQIVILKSELLKLKKLALEKNEDMEFRSTQWSWKWPYGAGLLTGGLARLMSHLHYNCPSENYFEYQAFAIGSRSQAEKIYMARRFETFI